MSLPSWLVPWWDWWAVTTQLFAWPAVSAFFSLGALLWAIRLATRSDRAVKRKDAVFLYYVANTIDYVVTPFESYQSRVKDGRKDFGVLTRATQQTLEKGGLIERLDSIKMDQFPTVASIQNFEHAKISISYMRLMIDHQENDDELDAKELQQRLDNCYASIRKLKKRARSSVSWWDSEQIQGNDRPILNLVRAILRRVVKVCRRVLSSEREITA